MNRLTLEELIRETDSLTYLNALKGAISELKEELATIEETREYQDQAVVRARKIMRRIDTQYRAVIKCTAKVYHPPEIDVNMDISDIVEEVENEDA